MSKGPTNKANDDTSEFCKSSFTISFAIEIIGIDVWHDCNEGWIDLGPCLQGLKIQYQVYPGRVYDLDILIWPHVAKIWCGTQSGWVRTWQFLERRWLAFSISHIFPVRVVELRNHVATVIPTPGLGAMSANAKNDKNIEAFLPRLKFGERRYFAPVIQEEQNILSSIQDLIWNAVEDFIPASYLDGVFDIPRRVNDIRHQDAVLYHVRETILNNTVSIEAEESLTEIEQLKRDRRESKASKEKEKKKVVEPTKTKFEIKLSGDVIIAGAGRIVPFETVGDRPADFGEIITLISSNNLPAQDDLPVIFINVENVDQVPVEEMKKARISQIYTRWKLGEEEHVSEPQSIKSKNIVTINDHHAVPIHYASISETIATFSEDPFEIELRGKRQQKLVNCNPSFFGYDQLDRNFGIAVPKPSISEPLDVLLAVTKINVRPLAKGIIGLVRGEFPLYPPSLLTTKLDRDGVCTNDINSIRAEIKPKVTIQPAIILQAQMTLEASIGLVGCKPKQLKTSFSRLYCFAYDSDTVITILNQINFINGELRAYKNRDDLITGFGLDTGDVVMLYIEGIKDGPILRIWELLEDFYGKVKSIFSSSDRYFSRLYPEMVTAAIPFQVIKMFAPLGVILACPSVYALPALPYPTKTMSMRPAIYGTLNQEIGRESVCLISSTQALLKIGRLIANKLRVAPSRAEMPSATELRSFRLELCVPCRISALNMDEGLSLFTPDPSQSIAGGQWTINQKLKL